MSKFIKILLFAHNDAFVEEIEISIGSIGTVYTYIPRPRGSNFYSNSTGF